MSIPTNRLGVKIVETIDIEGSASQDFNNFTLIHNGTILLGSTEYPAVSVKILAFDPDDECLEKL